MTASAETAPKQLPSTATLLFDALRITRTHASDLYGFAGWLLFPLLLYVVAHASGATGEQILSTAADVGVLLLTTWISAATILMTAFSVAHPSKHPDPRSIGTHAWGVMLSLIIAQLLVGILQLAGFIALVIPGVIVTTWLAFTSQEVVLHGLSGFKALAASRERVRGLFWPVLTRLFGIGATLFAILTLIMIGVGAVVAAVGDASILTSLTAAPPLWFDILANLIQISLLPPFLVAHTLLYLSITKE